jgi:hypothetical protein
MCCICIITLSVRGSTHKEYFKGTVLIKLNSKTSSTERARHTITSSFKVMMVTYSCRFTLIIKHNVNATLLLREISRTSTQKLLRINKNVFLRYTPVQAVARAIFSASAVAVVELLLNFQRVIIRAILSIAFHLLL